MASSAWVELAELVDHCLGDRRQLLGDEALHGLFGQPGRDDHDGAAELGGPLLVGGEGLGWASWLGWEGCWAWQVGVSRRSGDRVQPRPEGLHRAAAASALGDEGHGRELEDRIDGQAARMVVSGTVGSQEAFPCGAAGVQPLGLDSWWKKAP